MGPVAAHTTIVRQQRAKVTGLPVRRATSFDTLENNGSVAPVSVAPGAEAISLFGEAVIDVENTPIRSRAGQVLLLS